VLKQGIAIKKIIKLALQYGALVLFGVVMALGLVELLLRANPHLVPIEVRVSPPVRRLDALAEQTYQVKLSDGDLFYWIAGRIAPLTPEQNRVVAEVNFSTDGQGFRNALPEKDRYSVVALGDSFTVAANVASPWPQRVTDCTGLDVLNLGGAGLGPQEELEVLREYGLEKRPEWVVMAYFEGNDLYDAAAYDQANPFIVARLGRYMVTQGLEAWRERGEEPVPTAPANYFYPITVTINGVDLEIAFFSGYMAWLGAREELIRPSENYRLAQEAILEAKALSEAAEARLLLVYIPTKEHVYLPYLDDRDMLTGIFSDVPTLALDEDGFIQFTNQTATVEVTNQYRDDQAKLLADFAAEQDIAFLDLTATFQAEAADGIELYYPFDTHWNQQGHDLAAQTIGLYLANGPANESPCYRES
jgi:hypothetical protein